ncbi:3-deoxy-D-manno-octulosonic acid transferase, partial [bacterium]|nr:3-deoxy-D-manno-octulosonic acid transferase [bacterium]
MLIYEILSTILFAVLLPIYYIVRVFNGKFLYGWKEKLGFFKHPRLGDKVIMFHGVSVGEIIALENLIKKTIETFPEYKIVITTGTKTGQEIAQKKFSNIADYITYFPFDIASCVYRFLRKIHPSVVLIAETEIWPIFAYRCREMNIPLYMINGRMSDSTYSLYKIIGRFFKHILANYSGILTQSHEDLDKLLSIGAPKDLTRVMNNLKFDVKKNTETVDIKSQGSRLIIAGSTHKGEDEIILKAFKNLKLEFSDIKLLLVPRHMPRVPAVKELVKQTNLPFGMRSKSDDFSDKDIIILDTMGELGKMYSLCHFAFIGGSFNKTGGHNPLEAAVYSKPTISGPSIHNFKDIYGILGKSKAGKVVKNPQELEDYMRLLLSDNDFYNQACKDCETVFENQKGALDIVIN